MPARFGRGNRSNAKVRDPDDATLSPDRAGPTWVHAIVRALGTSPAPTAYPGARLVNLVTSPFFGGVAVRLDVTTGTVESAGGITGITGFSGGFNLGNFTFITGGATPTVFTVAGLSAHETGHTPNVAAFGSIWHLAGNAVEENLPPFAFKMRAYGEMLAEGHIPRAGVSPFVNGADWRVLQALGKALARGGRSVVGASDGPCRVAREEVGWLVPATWCAPTQ